MDGRLALRPAPHVLQEGQDYLTAMACAGVYVHEGWVPLAVPCCGASRQLSGALCLGRVGDDGAKHLVHCLCT